MTLSEVSTLCPAPEGMEWHEDGCGGFIAQAPNRTLCIDPEAEEGIRVSAWNVDDNVHFFATLADLPSAYRRALQAVGLAPDPEKEDLRRRLTWSEDVPTGDGLVLVWHPGDDEPEMWRTLGTADGIQWEHHNYVGHGNPFPPGTRFFPLANLKETR